MTNDEIAKGWVEYHLSGEDGLFHFTEVLLELVYEDPGRAWEIIRIIGSMNGCQDEWIDFIDSCLAAGVLEELLVTNGEKVAEILHQNPDMLNIRLRRQLSLVNHSRLSLSVKSSLEKTGKITKGA